MKIKLSTTLRWPIERQIPPSFADAGIEVVLNDRVESCDCWVVYQGLFRPDEAICPPDRVVLFTYEPPDFHNFATGFLEQFDKVVTCHRSINHRGLLLRHQAQPWTVGLLRDRHRHQHASEVVRFGYAELMQLPPPEKPRVVSAICSRRQDAPGHLARLAFLDALNSQDDCHVDLFGYGHHPIVDKFDGLLPYRFHIVLENTCIDHYWTEKLADAYLAYCLPLVWGCTNLEDYFPSQSFVLLDHCNPERAVSQVAAAVSAGVTPEQWDAVREARRRVLEEYNLFAEIRRMAMSPSLVPPRRVQIRDENLYCRGGWFRPAARLLKDCLHSELYTYHMKGGWKQTRSRILAADAVDSHQAQIYESTGA